MNNYSAWVDEIREEARGMWLAFDCKHSGLAPRCSGSVAPGYTYAIQAGEDGLIKIGHSRVSEECRLVFQRLADVQSMSPVKLRVVALMEGVHIEGWLHEKLKRHRLHCEWFAPCVINWFRRWGAPACIRCAVFRDGRPVTARNAALDRPLSVRGADRLLTAFDDGDMT